MSKYKIINAPNILNTETGAQIPNDPANADWQEYQEWLTDPANTPDPADAVVVTADMIKTEARRRILEKYPEWKQANLTARMVELNKIRASVGSWTAGEQMEVDAIQSAWDWVKSVRSASDALELILPVDYQDNSYWPAF
ncbi:MAG: hypothetical protein COV66_08055 [Nitrospinae bacterium CG11_big_fil_rev_8_21_14_0_20_45_15]|nr:MAG: hypothetical protein COV66_08055 [Nitrospinae bacterium CG11_big_fil_rev_8_21_14_0_20_45_15]